MLKIIPKSIILLVHNREFKDEVGKDRSGHGCAQ
jgi:hypothetical protein